MLRCPMVWSWGLGLVVVLGLSAREAAAQPPMIGGLTEPRVTWVFPVGGQVGTQVEIALAGQNLNDTEALLFSHPGLKAERMPEIAGPPLEARNPQQQVAMPQRGRRGAAAPSSGARFRVTIPPDTPLGLHDVRAVTPRGVSNPRAFVVGDLPEGTEEEPNDDVDKAQRIELNSVIQGAVPTQLDVDFFVFAGKKGQRVVLSCLTTGIDSRLEVAVELFDGSGRPLAANHGYHDNDAVLDTVLPGDGDYVIRVHQFTYTRGGADQFYRLSVATAPWIDAVYPPVVEAGKTTQVTVWGRNLPGGQPDPQATLDGVALERVEVPVTPPTDPKALVALTYSGVIAPVLSGVDGFDLRVRNDAGWSNPALLTFARGPVVLDAGDNDRPEQAQVVTLPCEIAGRITTRGDRDWYAFEAKKGDVLSIEAWGDRLGAPVDLFVLVRSVDGKQTLFEADENPEILHPVQFYSRTDDPQRQRFVAPADGRYTLLISAREATARSDPRFVYRLRIGPERPDFRLVAMPSSPHNPDSNILRQGTRIDYHVFVWRSDGFDGEIALSAQGLPPGVTCDSQGVGTGLRQGALVLTASADAAPWVGPVVITGTARIAGETVVREARPATISWPTLPQQNNLPALVRLDRSTILAVRSDPPPFTLSAETTAFQVVQGGKLEVPLKLQRLWNDFKSPVQVAALGLPPNINFNQVTLNPGNDTAKPTVTLPANAPPGEYFVVFRGQSQFQYSPDPKAQQKPIIQVQYPANPVTLVIIPKELAKLTVQPGTPTVKVGEQVEFQVKLARQFNYGGELRVEFLPPADAKGLSAESVTVAAGQDEAKLVLKAAADAPPGNRGNFVVKATGTFREGVPPIVQELKFNVNVTK